VSFVRSDSDSGNDRVAVVGIGCSPPKRDSGMTAETLALRAARDAIRDAGLTAADIDGVVGPPEVQARDIVSGLGLPDVAWWANTPVPFSFQVMEAVNAVVSGACTTALAYHTTTRAAGTSRAAASDPLRARTELGASRPGHTPDSIAGAVAYAAWAARYLAEFSTTREDFALVAINNRSNAVRNPNAPLRAPLTMDQYFEARMVRDPLCVLDMDYAVDGADAIVITSAQRAADFAYPVLVHAAAAGMTSRPVEDQLAGFADGGQNAVVKRLWARSQLSLDDIDIFYPYDGFSILNLRWLEVVGYCSDGEAGVFLKTNWDADTQQVLINGRVPMNTHGGSLSAGAMQGSGHILEAVRQLRGTAGHRQVTDARVALITPGGFFHNASALILRAQR
jgi:acetyl-CoA acetyltransferase